jgi:hypothetical protein
MAVFGTYYTVNMLRQMKWPRKHGVRKKEYFDTFIVDQTLNQMVDWAAAIGAGAPDTALKILAYIYKDRDWDGDDAPDFEMFVGSERKRIASMGVKASETAPHDLLQPFQFGEKFKSLPGNAFDNENARNFIETTFVNGLLYGLCHPRAYNSWYDNHLQEFEKNKELYKKIDIGVEELPSLKENLNNSIEIIELYEQEMNISFPPIPAGLKHQIASITKY